MSRDEVLQLLRRLERQLGTIADQAQETMRQARHVLDRVELLRRHVADVKDGLLEAADTAVFHSPLVEDL
jgi:hypothetical protein